MNKARHGLLNICALYSIKLNETYGKFFTLTSRQILLNYKADSKSKEKKKKIKSLKTRLGRLCRIVEKHIEINAIKLSQKHNEHLQNIKSIQKQSALKPKHLKEYKKENKYIYSLHAPEVECIAKGKPHKKFEFGNKVGLALTATKNFILAIRAFHGNPYDGHTLNQNVNDVQKNAQQTIEKLVVDRGYKGNDFKHKKKIFMPLSKRVTLSKSDKAFIKRRNAIEPIIGHLKTYFRLSRNFLCGKIGDVLNALRSAIGFNFRKIARAPV